MQGGSAGRKEGGESARPRVEFSESCAESTGDRSFRAALFLLCVVMIGEGGGDGVAAAFVAGCPDVATPAAPPLAWVAARPCRPAHALRRMFEPTLQPNRAIACLRWMGLPRRSSIG